MNISEWLNPNIFLSAWWHNSTLTAVFPLQILSRKVFVKNCLQMRSFGKYLWILVFLNQQQNRVDDEGFSVKLSRIRINGSSHHWSRDEILVVKRLRNFPRFAPITQIIWDGTRLNDLKISIRIIISKLRQGCVEFLWKYLQNSIKGGKVQPNWSVGTKYFSGML